jgi:hypothetical protein
MGAIEVALPVEGAFPLRCGEAGRGKSARSRFWSSCHRSSIAAELPLLINGRYSA